MPNMPAWVSMLPFEDAEEAASPPGDDPGPECCQHTGRHFFLSAPRVVKIRHEPKACLVPITPPSSGYIN